MEHCPICGASGCWHIWLAGADKSMYERQFGRSAETGERLKKEPRWLNQGAFTENDLMGNKWWKLAGKRGY